jgi:hypothetical protein
LHWYYILLISLAGFFILIAIALLLGCLYIRRKRRTSVIKSENTIDAPALPIVDKNTITTLPAKRMSAFKKFHCRNSSCAESISDLPLVGRLKAYRQMTTEKMGSNGGIGNNRTDVAGQTRSHSQEKSHKKAVGLAEGKVRVLKHLTGDPRFHLDIPRQKMGQAAVDMGALERLTRAAGYRLETPEQRTRSTARIPVFLSRDG